MKKLAALLFTVLILASAPAQADALARLASGGTGGWVNTTRPLTVEDFKGRVILLDFWTYGCINCMQVIPDLDYLEAKYPQLLIIGVHSAKYKGEGLNDRIRKAAERFSIHHPVMNDNDYKIWDFFDVNAWPTFILLDDKGLEINRYSGEGNRNALDADIARAVKNLPAAKADKLVAEMEDTGILSFPSHLIHAAQTVWGDVLFVSDTAHHRILAIAPDGKIKATIGKGAAGFEDGDLTGATFNRPRGMAYVDGILYVADTDNHALRGVDLKAGMVKTLAGTGKRGFNRLLVNLIGPTELASPWDLELMADGKTLAVANAGTHQLWSYDIATGKLGNLAGSGREDIKDAPAAAAQLAQPSALSLYEGQLYFVDAETSSLRVLTKDGHVKTLIGTGLFDFGAVDGKYPAASMQHPQGVYAAEGKVYVADTYNNAIRVYDLAGKALSTLSLQGGALAEPGDIYVHEGQAYVTDTGNHRVVKVDLATGQLTEIPLAQ